ncbi:MAG: hypothetical protein JXA25_05735 [Anaerolineales bacterium]|nr:hypothetical protein [Anaerolineales bacterium]
MQTHRERVRCALDFQQPDRVPLDLGGRVSNIHIEAYRRLASCLGVSLQMEELDPFYSVMEIAPAILERLGIDCYYLYLRGPEYLRRQTFSDGSYENEWGIRIEQLGHFSQRVTHPLAEVEKAALNHYPWPDPLRPERTEGLRERARFLYEETDYALVAAPVSGGLFEFGQHLRGMQNFLMDLLLNKSWAHLLLDHLLQIQTGLWQVYLDSVGPYVEMVQLADDFGTQTSLLISPALFREFFKPRYTELIRFIRGRTNAKVFFHCDGAIIPIIPDLMEMGVDVLNPLQPGAQGMNPGAIKALYGDKLVFHGAIDNQKLLPQGTPSEVRTRVRQVVQILAPGGGYILAPAHVIEPDIPVENILAMYDSAREINLQRKS